MDHEHKEIDARARAEVAMGRDGRHDRSAFAHGPPHHLNHASCRSLATYTSELAEVLSRFVYLVSTVALSRRGEAEREDFSTDIKVLGLSPFLHRRSYQPVGHMFRLTNLRPRGLLSAGLPIPKGLYS